MAELGETLRDIYSPPTHNDSIIVVDGYGLKIAVERGHLAFQDGIGPYRRERTLSRAQRTVHRLVILGHTGMITLDAIRWCADVGIAIVQIDVDGCVLMVGSNPARTDGRLLRAQAAAAGSVVGVAISRQLIAGKLAGQADVAEAQLHASGIAATIRGLAAELESAMSLQRCRDIEAQAANVYFGAWASVEVRFAARDADRVPAHWQVFAGRGSPLHRGGRSPRNAADPVNALANYGYALAEAECRLAALTVGLDPGLGIIHTDQKNRDSLALDLMEPLRPIVERHVLQLVAQRNFRYDDLAEQRDGRCRLLAPLTHQLAGLLPLLRETVGPVAESVAHALAASSPGQVNLRTPLTRANIKAVQTVGVRGRARAATAPAPTRTCQTCGAPLAARGRKLCESCWPVRRRELALARARRAQTAAAASRAAGTDPAQTPEARRRRSAALTAERAERDRWDESGRTPSITEAELLHRVLPALGTLPLRVIQEATGLSVAACSRLRSGALHPHPRHWDALAQLARTHGQTA